ncbi:MAG: hypothetical protein HYT67_00080 [Candidatus Yanofskybacteria bacterium]|nr:hypothetical protein [Candidatus Yanofskybacteria bacterium]
MQRTTVDNSSTVLLSGYHHLVPERTARPGWLDIVRRFHRTPILPI